MVIKSDGSLWGWGYNNYGQLGDGTREFNLPIKILDDVIQVSTCGYGTMAIKSDKTLWAWGVNLPYGTLSSNYDNLTPIKIMDEVIQVAVGGGREGKASYV